LKSRILASLLAFFFGSIGLHRAYLGRFAWVGLHLAFLAAGLGCIISSAPGEMLFLGGWALLLVPILLGYTDAIAFATQSDDWFQYRHCGGPKPIKQPSSLPKGEWRFRLLVLLFLGLIFIPFMGSFGLWDPWETHYGEVGRSMIERGDWVSTWWGSHWRDANGHSEGNYFYSKPVLLMWMMAMGLETFGFSEWGIRFGVALIALLGSFMVYEMGREIWNRRAGILMSVVVTTSPFWAMLGRQSQTDMPYVGLMTVGMCFLLMGMFGKRKDEAASPGDVWLLLTTYLVMFIPQMQLVWVKFSNFREELPFMRAFFRYGPVLVALYSVGVLVVLIWFLYLNKNKTKRQVWMLGFYLFVALATLAKGLLGFALPGLIALVYLLLTGEWWRLLKLELHRGIILFLTICCPWYASMFLRHGMDYYNRFIVHDHLRRLASGVHQTDNGSFEHFVKWLGYGLFPWVAFIPAAFARITGGDAVGKRTDQQRARLMLVLWAVLAFTIFTLGKTKFHHYIFPCVPAIAMLVGLYLEDLFAKKVKNFFPLYLTAVAIFVMIGYDLFSEPQNLKNLFTYQYDRKWQPGLTAGFATALKFIFGVGLLGFFLLVFTAKRIRTAAISAIMVCSTSLTVWALDVYMPSIAVDWSQGYLWQTYYNLCTPISPPTGAPDFKPYCAEPIVAYKLNWRGETYYTHNEVIPCEDDSDFQHFLDQNDGRSFYAIMQQGRSFTSSLPSELRPGVQEVHNENEKFMLVRVLNEEDRLRLEEVSEHWLQ